MARHFCEEHFKKVFFLVSADTESIHIILILAICMPSFTGGRMWHKDYVIDAGDL